jgi:plasmid stabilization system protein ParE
VRIRYTDGALADLEAIHDHQAIHWPSRDAAFEARLSAIERRLLQFPNGAPEVAEWLGVRLSPSWIFCFVYFPA